MRVRFAYIVHKLRESFWFLPSLLALAAIALSVVTVTIDRNTQALLTPAMPWTQGLGADCVHSPRE